MNRICTSLAHAGYDVTLLGRELPDSLPLDPQKPYQQKRFRMWFNKGKLFYLSYNLRLLWYFLTHSYDLYGATDLDTLLPNFIAAKLRRKPHTYDAHEYFAELPEIVDRPLTRFIWKTIEQYIVPRTRYCYTINHTYVQLFVNAYQVPFQIVRNATVLRALPPHEPAAERYILYQGAVNVGRGVEEMIAALPLISNCKLYVCGKGDVWQTCVDLAARLGLTDRVVFMGWVTPQQLLPLTQGAALGFTFFTNHGYSYYYSLANRFFDYMHSAVPQLCVDFPEYRHICERYAVAQLLPNLSPQTIAKAANKLLNDPHLYQQMQQNCRTARQIYCWQHEEKTLLGIYECIFAQP